MESEHGAFERCERTAHGFVRLRFVIRTPELTAPHKATRGRQHVEVRQIVGGRGRPMERPARFHQRHVERAAVECDDQAGVVEDLRQGGEHGRSPRAS
jgi:hypothetical protein